jgi:hypothetical protein
MKRILMLCGLVAAFMGLAQSADAQYLPAQIHRDGAGFVDDHGRTLSDRELIDAVGIDIFEDTVTGARKQYTAGRKLLTAGIITSGAGILTALGGAALFVANDGGHYYLESYYDSYPNRNYSEERVGASLGALMMIGGYVAIFTGGAALSAGIPLKVIGQSRLNWVENDYNDRQPVYTLHVGATPSGVGIALEF